MEDREVALILRAYRQIQEEAVPKEHSQKTPACPSLPRFREGLLDPRRWTAEERRHLESDCAYCQKTLAMSQRNVWHPDLSSLLLWLVGQLTGEEAPYVRVHLEEDTCLRCTTFVRALQVVPFLKRLVERVRQGRPGTVERTDGFFNGLVRSAEPVRVLAGAFAEEIPFDEFASPDGSLRIALQQRDEAEGGGPLLVVKVRDGSWAGDHVIVTATDPEGTRVVLHERVPMTRRSAKLWEGELPLNGEQQQGLTEEVWLWGERE